MLSNEDLLEVKLEVELTDAMGLRVLMFGGLGSESFFDEIG